MLYGLFLLLLYCCTLVDLKNRIWAEPVLHVSITDSAGAAIVSWRGNKSKAESNQKKRKRKRKRTHLGVKTEKFHLLKRAGPGAEVRLAKASALWATAGY